MTVHLQIGFLLYPSFKTIWLDAREYILKYFKEIHWER